MDDFERWRHEVDRRLSALESKAAKKSERKAIDTSRAKPINLRNMESEVEDGEMFSFIGKYFWSENKGKFTKIAFSPLDAGRDEKAGKFFTTFDSLPTWLQKGQAVDVVAQCKAKPPYMNYLILTIEPLNVNMAAIPPANVAREPFIKNAENSYGGNTYIPAEDEIPF